MQTGSGQYAGLCEFCQYATGDEFAASFNVYYDHRWRDYGIFWAYIVFNLAIVFLCSWLYLGGMKKIRGAFKRSKKSGNVASADGQIASQGRDAEKV